MVADPPAPTPSEMTGCVKAKDSDVVLFLPVTGLEGHMTQSWTRRLEGDLPGGCREGFP